MNFSTTFGLLYLSAAMLPQVTYSSLDCQGNAISPVDLLQCNGYGWGWCFIWSGAVIYVGF